ncbi:transposase [Rhizobium beringeri]
MEIVDSGRRRRFTDEAKLAIVAESYNGPRQVTATAQRHGITRWQLNAWRRAAREGRACPPLDKRVCSSDRRCRAGCCGTRHLRRLSLCRRLSATTVAWRW